MSASDLPRFLPFSDLSQAKKCCNELIRKTAKNKSVLKISLYSVPFPNDRLCCLPALHSFNEGHRELNLYEKTSPYMLSIIQNMQKSFLSELCLHPVHYYLKLSVVLIIVINIILFLVLVFEKFQQHHIKFLDAIPLMKQCHSHPHQGIPDLFLVIYICLK